MKIEIPENYHTIENTVSFEVVKISDFEFIGKIIDVNGNSIKLLGMDQNNIGYSHNYNTTYTITEKYFNELIKIKSGGKAK